MRGSKKTSIWIIVLTLLILVVTNVNAAQFTADIRLDENSKSAKPCETTKFEIYVNNIGTVVDRFDIGVRDTDPKWIALTKNQITLSPGTGELVSAYITPPCEAYGEQNVTLTFTSAISKLRASLPLNLNIDREYGYDLQIGKYDGNVTDFTTSTNSVCSDEKTLIPIKLSNNVALGNIYRLSLANNSEFIRLKNTGVAVWGNSYGVVDITLSPSFKDEGNHSFELRSKSERGDIEIIQYLYLEVRRCKGVMVEIKEENDEYCSLTEKVYNIEIENLGDEQALVKLNTEGITCAELSRDDLWIKSKGVAGSFVKLPAECEGIGQGQLNVRAWLNSSPEIFSEDSINLTIIPVQDCYRTEISGETQHFMNEESRVISLTNNGNRNAIYNLSLEGPEVFSLGERTLQINPGSDGNVTLNFKPVNDTKEGRYKIKLSAEVDGKVRFSRNINAVYGEESWKGFLLYYWYYTLIVFITAVLILVEFGIKLRNWLQVVNVKRFRELSKKNEIRCGILDNMAITQFTFTPKVNLNRVKVIFHKLKIQPFKKAGKLVYEYFRIGSKKIQDNFEKGLIGFKVKRPWIDNNKLKEEDIGLRFFANNTWKDVKTAIIKEDKRHVYFEAKIANLGLFAIVNRSEEIVEQKKVTDKKVPKKIVESEKIKPQKDVSEKQLKKPSRWKELGYFVTTFALLFLFIWGIFIGYIYYIVGGLVTLGIVILAVNLKDRKRHTDGSDENQKKVVKETPDVNVHIEKPVEKLKSKDIVEKTSPKEIKMLGIGGFIAFLVIVSLILFGAFSGYIFYIVGGLIGLMMLVLVLDNLGKIKSENNIIKVDKEDTKKVSSKNTEVKKVDKAKVPKSLRKVKEKKPVTIRLASVIKWALILLIIAGALWGAFVLIVNESARLKEVQTQVEETKENQTSALDLQEEVGLELPEVIKSGRSEEENLASLQQILTNSVKYASVSRANVIDLNKVVGRFVNLVKAKLDIILLIFGILFVFVILVNLFTDGKKNKKTLKPKNKVVEKIADFFLEDKDQNKKK